MTNKGISTTTGILIILAIAVVAGALIWWQMGDMNQVEPEDVDGTEQEEAASVEQEAAQEHSETKTDTYTSTQYGVQFSFPQEWEILHADPTSSEEPTLASGLLVAINPSRVPGNEFIGSDVRYETDGYVRLQVPTDENFRTPEAVQTIYDAEDIESVHTVTIAGRQATQIDIRLLQGDGANSAISLLYIPLESGGYLSLIWDRNEEGDVMVANQIASTLKVE